MPVCKVCGCQFPNWHMVEGKRRNLSKRAYCLNCSPFGSDNRRRLHVRPTLETPEERRQKREKQARKRVQRHTGTQCWRCGWDGSEAWEAMEFVSVESQRTMTVKGAARQVSREGPSDGLKRHIFLCCRCSKEAQLGIMSRAELAALLVRWQ